MDRVMVESVNNLFYKLQVFIQELVGVLNGGRQ